MLGQNEALIYGDVRVTLMLSTKLFLQNAASRAHKIPVDVATLQMTRTGDVIAFTPVQHAIVVKAHDITCHTK